TPELHPLTVPRRLDFRARRPRRRSLNTIPPDDASASFSNRDDSPVRVWRKPLADLAQAGPGPAGGAVGEGIDRKEITGRDLPVRRFGAQHREGRQDEQGDVIARRGDDVSVEPVQAWLPVWDNLRLLAELAHHRVER